MTTTTLALDASWTQPHGCLATNDLWLWDDGTYAADVLGAPTATACYPDGYRPADGMRYEAAACPDGFHAACATGSLTTCCPTAHDFVCAAFTVGSLYVPCSWDYASPFTAAFTSTSFASGGSGSPAETNTMTISAPSRATITTAGGFPFVLSKGTDGALGAMGVVIVTPTGGASSTATTTSSARAGSAADSSPGLTAGAAAGIGVGAAAGVCLLAAAGAWLALRRRHDTERGPGRRGHPGGGWWRRGSRAAEPKTPPTTATADGGSRLYEMQTPAPRHELDGGGDE